MLAEVNALIEEKQQFAMNPQHVFLIGSKSIGQYGGFETFVDRLIDQHQNESQIKYHIACKANGHGYMDESLLSDITVLKRDEAGNVTEFEYKNAHVFKIHCPEIGSAMAVYYDRKALLYSLNYCREHQITDPVFYILACRSGLFISRLVRRIKAIGGKYYLNPDGHEWKRTKWPRIVRIYWKWSERKMVKCSDLVICDSKIIEEYIRNEYGINKTVYISYGADIRKSTLTDDDPEYVHWLQKNGLEKGEYYLAVGRFVPENNYETMIREFMKSKTNKEFVLITNENSKYRDKLDKKLHWKNDRRIKFVGTVYDRELLKKIRENAFAYIHGHEVGGTNPSLLEALGSTDLNLLFDIGFNKEVGHDAALYWTRALGNLAALIDRSEGMSDAKREEYGKASKERIKTNYSWEYIGEEYRKVFLQK